jgi:exodeoxyribonuclease X
MEKQYILRVIDFETTGIPGGYKPQSVVEAAFVDIDASSKRELASFSSLVVPETDMEITALAVHHIQTHEAQEHGKRMPIINGILQEKELDQDIIFVAHNSEFEKYFFKPEGSRWIDTYKVALVLYPDAPSHSNQVLKYYLEIHDAPRHHPPHRALPDCYVTTEILLKMANQTTLKEMVRISKEPPFYTKLTFGKHKGKKYEEVPHDYLDWLLKQPDMDDGVHAAAKRVLSHA